MKDSSIPDLIKISKTSSEGSQLFCMLVFCIFLGVANLDFFPLPAMATTFLFVSNSIKPRTFRSIRTAINSFSSQKDKSFKSCSIFVFFVSETFKYSSSTAPFKPSVSAISRLNLKSLSNTSPSFNRS